jgi:hypothetical protein
VLAELMRTNPGNLCDGWVDKLNDAGADKPDLARLAEQYSFGLTASSDSSSKLGVCNRAAGDSKSLLAGANPLNTTLVVN